jgi:hypothetical protein
MGTVEVSADVSRSTMTDFSLREQIEEVEREIALRMRVYPGQIRMGKMRVSVAEYHMNRIRAVLDTLIRLQTQRERKKERAADVGD